MACMRASNLLLCHPQSCGTMARFIRLTGGAPAPPIIPPTAEAIWREGLRVCSGGAQIQLHMAGRTGIAERMPEYCDWLTKQHGIISNHGVATICCIDFKNTGLTDGSVLFLTNAIAAVCPALRVLKLYENKLTDAKPFVDLLLRAHLLELHLCHGSSAVR